MSFSEFNSAYLIEGGYVVTLGDNSFGQRGLGINLKILNLELILKKKRIPLGHNNQIDVPTLVTGIKFKFITVGII